MAGISYKSAKNLFINPTAGFVPVKGNNGFDNSLIYQDNNFMYFYTDGSFTNYYLNYDFTNDILQIGDPGSYGTYVYMNAAGLFLIETATVGGGLLYIYAPTDVANPLGSTSYMLINVNGSNYKIKIRRP